PPFAIALVLPQVVQMSHRDRRQPLEFKLAILLILALQDVPCGRAAQVFMRLIHTRQQLDIGTRIALGKTVSLVIEANDLSPVQVASDQSRHLRSASPRHLGDIASPPSSWS